MMTAEEKRFWEKVDKSGSCWLWTAGRNKYGYGVFMPSDTRKTQLAHRMSWYYPWGRFPVNELDHLCRIRNCVNPDHLEEVTRTEHLRHHPPSPEFRRKTYR